MANASLSVPAPGTKGPSISLVTAIVLLTAFWVTTLTETPALPGGSPRSLEGRLRRHFENNAPGIRALAVPMNGLLYLFGERRGADTVFVARSSTRGQVLLFTPEMELERRDAEQDPAFVRNISHVQERIAALREAGVATVLLVPVPTKISVELATDPSLRRQAREIPARPLASGTAPQTGWRSNEIPDGHRTTAAYEGFANSLDSTEGTRVVSLQHVFVSRPVSPDDPVFSYEDTHWTSLGLNLAAAAIVRAWRGAEPSLVRAGRRPDTPGDLQRMLAVPNRTWFRAHPLDEYVYVLSGPSGGSACPGAAFLLGTSYSSYGSQTLAGQVTQGSGCAVTGLSRAGKGPVAGFPVLLGEHREALKGATVIWEFPFRDLVDPASFTTPP